MEQTNKYELGTRLKFLWKDNSYTPGTVVSFDRGIVVVQWDDGKVTRSSVNFISKYTRSFA